MIIKKAEFIKSASGSSGFYSSQVKQLAVAGKSNVGKSSFINMIANRKNLARTSNTPGRTRLINYFDMGSFILTDLPGYGYAKVCKEDKEKWGELIETYLTCEPSLIRVIMLVDIRHPPTAQDKQLADYLYKKMIPFNIIATKADKINKNDIRKRLMEIAADLNIGYDNIIATSAETGLGKEQTFNLIESILKNAAEHDAEKIEEIKTKISEENI